MSDDRTDDSRAPIAARIERADAPDAIALIVLEGELDLAVSGRFGELLTAAVADRPRAVVVDATGVGFIDSTMLRELLRAHRDVTAAGARFVIAGAQASVRRLLDLTGTVELFDLADSREAAIASVT